MGFLSQISFEDLKRLRTALKAWHDQNYPGDPLTDQDCDRIIDEVGEETQEKMLRAAIEGKFQAET